MRSCLCRGLRGSTAVVALLGLAFLPCGLLAEEAGTPKTFAIGNRLVSRLFLAERDQAFTQALRARTETKVTSKEFEILCRGDGHDVVISRYNSSPKGWTLSPSGAQGVLVWLSEAPALEIQVHYRVDGDRPHIFKWLEVTNRGDRPVRLARATVDALEVANGGEPLRGGVGQPVLLRNEFFLGIEHPAGANEVRGQGITLSHYPEAEIAPGGTWKSKRAVLGAAVGPDESVEEAFRNYLVTTTGRTPKYQPIYCDWAAHDELGTLVKPQLTERLTHSLLAILESMRSEHGVQFDYYLMDAFWYDPQGAYLTFKQPNWPSGYAPAGRRMLALGMKPGLWFDVGGSTLDFKGTPGWHGPEKPCLSDPQFSELLARAFETHIRHHSLALLKFDFANLLCRHDDSEMASLAILEKNADALREVCEKARQSNPVLVIRAYNTFSLREMMDSTKHYGEAFPVSPWWLFWFDSLYSGDPRPSELPSVTSLRDSVIWYQDHAYRGFARSLLPLFMIDDCGTLVGKTSTIYYLGAEGFTDSWLLNIMRGDLAPIFYGDLALLTENDRRFMAATLRLLREHQKLFARTRPILGIPGQGQVYGYLAQDNALAFVTVVNPGLLPQSFSVQVPSSDGSPRFQKLLFSNDGRARGDTYPSAGVLTGKLIPGEIRVYALASRQTLAALSLPPAPTRQYHAVTPIPNPFGERREAQLKITPQQAGMTLAVIVQYRKGGKADRSYDRPQEVMKVAGEIAGKPVSFASIPREGTDIWSRCSWAVFNHRIAPREANQTLKLRLVGAPPAGTTWTITALWLK